MCDMFGGPSQSEEALQSQEQGLAGTMSSWANQQYQQQQTTNQQLNSEINRIQSGTTGPGFGGAENAALISGIQNQGAAAGRNAIQAARSVGAGTASGSGLTRQSGINAQQAGDIEARVGAATANELNQEQVANYETGRANAITTAQALQTMANSFNPLGYGNAASSANSSAFSQAETINQQKIARAQAIASFAEQAAGAVATGGIGGLAGMGNMGGGVGGFLKAGANSLGLGNFQPPPPAAAAPSNMFAQPGQSGGLDYSSWGPQAPTIG